MNIWNLVTKLLSLYIGSPKSQAVLKVLEQTDNLNDKDRAQIFLKKANKVISNSNIEKSLNKFITKSGFKTPQSLFDNLFSDPTGVAENIANFNKEQKQAFKELVDLGTDQEDDHSPLSSSWLTYGVYENISPDGRSGNLTLTTKTGRSYTYFSVSRQIWEAMKQAKGKNGSGAGTIFWALYLRKYRKSASLQKQALAFKLAGIQPSKQEVGFKLSKVITKQAKKTLSNQKLNKVKLTYKIPKQFTKAKTNKKRS
jgi:hypothetical protein